MQVHSYHIHHPPSHSNLHFSQLSIQKRSIPIMIRIKLCKPENINIVGYEKKLTKSFNYSNLKLMMSLIKNSKKLDTK